MGNAKKMKKCYLCENRSKYHFGGWGTSVTFYCEEHYAFVNKAKRRGVFHVFVLLPALGAFSFWLLFTLAKWGVPTKTMAFTALCLFLIFMYALWRLDR